MPHTTSNHLLVFRDHALRAHADGGMPDARPSFDNPRLIGWWLALLGLLLAAAVCAALLLSAAPA